MTDDRSLLKGVHLVEFLTQFLFDQRGKERSLGIPLGSARREYKLK
jgi:hypothetical protein